MTNSKQDFKENMKKIVYFAILGAGNCQAEGTVHGKKLAFQLIQATTKFLIFTFQYIAFFLQCMMFPNFIREKNLIPTAATSPAISLSHISLAVTTAPNASCIFGGADFIGTEPRSLGQGLRLGRTIVMV
jgi:hypothetical protein